VADAGGSPGGLRGEARRRRHALHHHDPGRRAALRRTEPGVQPRQIRAARLDERQHGDRSRLPALIREVIGAGFPKILLYLGGDGGGEAYRIAYTQLDLLRPNDDYRTTLYRYCVVLPGWDGVFYGWPLEQIQPWAAKFRAYVAGRHLGLHYSTGHIPLGEGGSDFKPGGRMQDFDLLVGEYDDNCTRTRRGRSSTGSRRTTCGRRISPRRRSGSPLLPERAVPRGRWGHFAMEFGEYEAVRCGQDFAAWSRTSTRTAPT
jgi:hypothetical protein